MTPTAETDELCINTIRTLSMDAVQKANSGHPGTAMGLAPTMYCLWQRFLRFDPEQSLWPNRDRFVLSVGHASMLLYSTLHLAQVKGKGAGGDQSSLAVTMDEIQRFRQIDSRTPGHPEHDWTAGVECTTGPLGQGVAMSVGMAIARQWLGAHYNRPGFELFDFDVYALCGDGCMMEGISSEAASLAAHLRLSNLCWIYDNNRITIEGHTDLAFSEDVATRFMAYGWNVLRVTDANDLERLERAFHTFKQTSDRPTLIIVDSHIAWGAPNLQDTHKAHGEPLGEEEIRLTKEVYHWPEAEKFQVPAGIYEAFQAGVGERGARLRVEWESKFDEYARQHPDLADQVLTMQRGELPAAWDKDLPVFPPDPKGLAGRDASAKALNVLAQNVPWLLGGSADLAPSTKTRLTFEGAGDFEADSYGGRNFHFGIREHAMGAILNGMALTKVRPYGSGFLIFSDYGRPAIRLSAIMEIPTIHVFTHDSIGVGEDGPTHQPIEQLLSLRAIPHLIVLRPGDANETVEAWKVIMRLKHNPALMVVSRQAVPTLDRSRYAPASGVARGAYVLAEAPGGSPEVLLLATGSEVPMTVEAYEQLVAEGIRARVVSMPSWELFEQQPQEYKDEVLPPTVTARVSVEMSAAFGWERYIGLTGHAVGMRSFGASAPLKDLQSKFGFTVDAIVAAAKEQMSSG